MVLKRRIYGAFQKNFVMKIDKKISNRTTSLIIKRLDKSIIRLAYVLIRCVCILKSHKF